MSGKQNTDNPIRLDEAALKWKCTWQRPCLYYKCYVTKNKLQLSMGKVFFGKYPKICFAFSWNIEIENGSVNALWVMKIETEN